MEKPSREWLTKLFNIDFKQRIFFSFAYREQSSKCALESRPFHPSNISRIAPSDLIHGVHFVLKDFTIDKPSYLIDTSTKTVDESNQFVS